MNIKTLLPLFLFISASFPTITGGSHNGTIPTEPRNIELLKSGETFSVNKKESSITWKGAMQFIPKSDHIGYVDISKGRLMIEKGNIVGGSFEIDMKTITLDDHDSENDLIKHLKSSDFFDVDKFPTSSFEIKNVETRAEASKISGDLTIKGITHSVTFPAKVERRDQVLQASGKLTIDRTQWGVRYRSGKFFDNLADEAIADSIEFDIKIVANSTVN